MCKGITGIITNTEKGNWYKYDRSYKPVIKLKRLNFGITFPTSLSSPFGMKYTVTEKGIRFSI